MPAASGPGSGCERQTPPQSLGRELYDLSRSRGLRRQFLASPASASTRPRPAGSASQVRGERGDRSSSALGSSGDVGLRDDSPSGANPTNSRGTAKSAALPPPPEESGDGSDTILRSIAGRRRAAARRRPPETGIRDNRKRSQIHPIRRIQ
jgi:hypothetical protein